MPTRPLPKELVKRLTRTAPRLERLLGKMTNVDYRASHLQNPNDTSDWGGRVREVNVRKSSPEIPVVLKIIHRRVGDDDSALETIEWIQKMVKEHNDRIRRLPPARRPDYVLKKPYAYAISHNLIAMAKNDAPVVTELFLEKTERGEKMLERLKTKHGISARQVENSADALDRNLGPLIGFGNILLLGFKNGKFVFMPLVDKF